MVKSIKELNKIIFFILFLLKSKMNQKMGENK